MTELDNAFHNIISDIWSDMANINRGMEKEYKRLQVECQEWRKDAERLAKYFTWEDGKYGTRYCIHCDGDASLEKDIINDPDHAPDCPIILHQQLVEKYSKTYKPSSEVRILKDGE